MWDERHLNVMVDEPGILTAVQAHPPACEEFWWGKRLRALSVNLSRCNETLAAELLADAWERKAPARLRRRIAHR